MPLRGRLFPLQDRPSWLDVAEAAKNFVLAARNETKKAADRGSGSGDGAPVGHRLTSSPPGRTPEAFFDT